MALVSGAGVFSALLWLLARFVIGAKYRDVAYLDRRIKECKSEIRARKKNTIHYEEILSAIENGEKKSRVDGTPITVEMVTS